MLNEGHEDFRIRYVNVTEGRKDLSIVEYKLFKKVTFKLVNGFNKESFVARTTLIEQINSTGWGHLLVHSSSKYSDTLQAYFSGVLEGIITKPLIEAHWYNRFQNYCSNHNCTKLFKYLQENFVSLVFKSRNSSGFMKMVRLQLWQIKGLQDGYDGDWKQSFQDINEEHLLKMKEQMLQLYLLQADCDLDALTTILDDSKHYNKFSKTNTIAYGRCSALIKYVKGSLFTAHVTWDSYTDMLRLTKLYDFSYRYDVNESSNVLVPATKISFSSYPGQLASLDDFYITSAGLIILETTISNFNYSLWKPLANMASEVILSYARGQAANRLATTGAEWANFFRSNNSGTYNNQWMIVDNNIMKNHTYGEYIPDGALYIVEQLPGIVISEDVTQHLRNSTYWASYNLPYNKTIWKEGGFQSLVDNFGDYYDYEKCPRAQIFKRNASDVLNYESMMRLMRYNDFKNDPFAKCKCTPPYSATNAISARSDLNLKNGKYSIYGQGYSLNGGIDMKLTSTNLAVTMQFIGINGPTYDQQPVFDWNQIKETKEKHKMHPVKFQFSPIMTPFN